MKTIANVAIPALEELKQRLLTDLHSFHPMWLAWREIRKQGNSDAVNTECPASWRALLIDHIHELQDRYKHGSKFDKRTRDTFTETANMRVVISIMGGYKDAPRWEVECNPVITHYDSLYRKKSN